MRTILIFVVSVGLIGSARAETAQIATAHLKQSNEKIQRILKRRPTAGSPDEQQAKNDMKAIVNQLLDYRELARRSLGTHWDAQPKVKQEEFVKTLRDLIEKNYVKQLRTNLDYLVMYKGEETTDGVAAVRTVVRVKTKGKSTDVSIDYKMKKLGDHWMVFDVITDEVSMVKNYRAQFNKIITNESFDALLGKMKKKIAEKDDETK